MSFSLAQTLPLSCLLESPALCPGGLKEHMALVTDLKHTYEDGSPFLPHPMQRACLYNGPAGWL